MALARSPLGYNGFLDIQPCVIAIYIPSVACRLALCFIPLDYRCRVTFDEALAPLARALPEERE